MLPVSTNIRGIPSCSHRFSSANNAKFSKNIQLATNINSEPNLDKSMLSTSITMLRHEPRVVSKHYEGDNFLKAYSNENIDDILEQGEHFALMAKDINESLQTRGIFKYLPPMKSQIASSLCAITVSSGLGFIAGYFAHRYVNSTSLQKTDHCPFPIHEPSFEIEKLNLFKKIQSEKDNYKSNDTKSATLDDSFPLQLPFSTPEKGRLVEEKKLQEDIDKSTNKKVDTINRLPRKIPFISSTTENINAQFTKAQKQRIRPFEFGLG